MASLQQQGATLAEAAFLLLPQFGPLSIHSQDIFIRAAYRALVTLLENSMAGALFE